MKHNKQKKKKNAILANTHNHPTPERMGHGGITFHNNIGISQDPLRIDKLLKNEIIDEMQHLYGMQIITLWTIASRPFLKAMHYEPRSGSISPNFEHINLSRMHAEDQFYKVMGLLGKRDHGLIVRICFEEMAAIEAGRQMGLPINSITVYVRAAFDALGNALSQMRRMKKEMEKAAEEKNMPETMDA